MQNGQQNSILQSDLVGGAQVFVNKRLDHYLTTEGKQRVGYKELTRSMFKKLEKHLNNKGTEDEIKRFHSIVETIFIFDYTRRL